MHTVPRVRRRSAEPRRQVPGSTVYIHGPVPLLPKWDQAASPAYTSILYYNIVVISTTLHYYII